MICGSVAMRARLDQRPEARNLVEGSGAAPGDYLIEKVFAER